MKKIILGLGLFVFGLFFITNSVFAASVGPNNPSSGVNTTGFGSTAWSNSSNITSVGSPYATVTLTPGSSSNYLKATSYGFNIPLSATIDGIEVKIDRKGEQNLGFGFRDDVLKLVKGGVISGDDKSSSNTYPTTLSTKTYGANNDKWGLSWTAADINASNFGVVLSTKSNLIISTLTASVNSIQVIVHYTITTGDLQITKTAIGGNSTFSFTGGAGSFNISTTAGTGNTTRTNLTPGTYSVTETAQSGWDMNSNTCTDVVITAGNTSNCTITNTKRGSITVYKDVKNPDEGAVVDGHWFGIKLNDANPQNISEFNSYTYTNLVPGTYTITEDVDPDYDFMTFSADNDPENSGAQITVSAGANTNLTIVNKQKKGSIIVNKTVTNPNGGKAVAGNFYFSLNGGEAIQFIQDEMNSLFGSFTLPSVNPGAFSIAEVMIPSGNYAISYSGNCSGLLESNGSKTCNITNSDIPEGKGAITVVKNVINDDGGMMVASDFPLYINPTEGEGMMAENGVSYFLDPGTYNVSEMMSESLASKYMQTSLVCINGKTETSGQVVLSAQASWVCTITNNDKPANLTIVKNVVNDAWNATTHDGTFTINISGMKEGLMLTTTESTAQTTIEMNKGSYALSEPISNDWYIESISCGENYYSEEEILSGTQITLENGQNMTCTFVNKRKTGTLIVNKTVSNDDGKTLTLNDFPGFTVAGSEPVPFEANEEQEGPIMAGSKTLTLELGTYTISEPITEGYFKVPENCDPVYITWNQTSTCSFRNEDIGFYIHSGGGEGGGGSVAGAFTENTENTNTTPAETPKEEIKGEVLGATSCNTKYLENFLFFGKKNPKLDVEKLQVFLNDDLGLNLKIDGHYGISTRNAVSAFQEKNKKEVLDPWIPFGKKDGKGTGNVYKTTLRWINMTKCPDLNLPMPELP